MIIHLSKIPEEGRSYQGEEPGEILGLGPGDSFQAPEPVTYDLYVQVVDGTLIVRGTVSAELEVSCARCTQFFSTTVTDSGFLRDYSDVSGTEEVDITEDIREALLLNLPHFPLCNEECKGLCPHCGADLNTEACRCSAGAEGGPWGALDNLKI